MLRLLVLPLLFLITFSIFSQAQQTTATSFSYDTEYLLAEIALSNYDEYQYLNTSAAVSDTSYAAKQNLDDERPLSVRLHQNYPNPFNPATTIAFRIPENSGVQIEVFDQLGRSVDIILNETRSAGDHDITYDASHLPSGIYIYRMEWQGLESGNRQVFTRKFTLLK